MADLNVNKSDTTRTWENPGGNLVPNPGFESAPAFTAATNTTQAWINGTAGGSATDDSHYWAINTLGGTASAQFDSTNSNSGTNSMKLSIAATSSNIVVDITRKLNDSATGLPYAVPVDPSTAYTITYWSKINVTSGSSRGAYIRVGEHGVAPSFATGTTHDGTFVGATTGWTKYTISFTTASTTAFLDLQLTLSGTVAPATLIADAWFDDISISPTTLVNNVSLSVGPIVTPGIQNISGPKIWS